MTTSKDERALYMSIPEQTVQKLDDIIALTTSKVDVFALNDVLGALAFDMDVRLEDDDLDTLTHIVKEFLETKGKEFS